MQADYHMHTVLCKHAEGAAADFAAEALKKGIPEICFTDHAPAPDGYDSVNRMDIAVFPQYMDLVAAEMASMKPIVLFGIEADYYEGCLPFLSDWLSRQEFDLVLGSIHYINDWAFDNPDNLNSWKSVDVTGAWRAYFNLVSKLADTKLFDVLTHPDLPKKFGYRPKDRDIKEMVQPALDRMAAAGMGIEINTSGLRRPVKEIYPSPLILALAREREIPITFGSDAHAPHEVGAGFAEALKLAKDCGYTHYTQFRKRKKTLVSF